MTHIGLLSDTHGHLDKRIFKYFEKCDEIWHAGDIGSVDLLDELAKFKMTRAVYGNIDDQKIRKITKKDTSFMCEQLKVFMTHIGGYPGKYNFQVYQKIKYQKPDLFICGHSHILKIMRDKTHNLLHINPGACGNYGFHKVKTLVRFSVDKKQILDLEVIELG